MGYPVSIDAIRPVSQPRLSVALRFPLALPAVVWSVLLMGGAPVALVAALVVTGRVPRWLYEFQVNVNR